MKERFRLTVGFDEHERQMAIITTGGHPQLPGSGDCIICDFAFVDEIPDGDLERWFLEQIETRPWETRQ